MLPVGVFVHLFACQQVVFYGAKAFSFYNQPDSNSAFAVWTERLFVGEANPGQEYYVMPLLPTGINDLF